MNREELAWAAGFFDGEGSIIVKRGEWNGVALTIGQVDTFVLERFRNAVGIGRVVGPYTPNQPNRKPYWRYRVEGFNQPQAVVAKLWKWLSPTKRSQATAVLNEMKQYYARPKSKGGRPRKATNV